VWVVGAVDVVGDDEAVGMVGEVVVADVMVVVGLGTAEVEAAASEAGVGDCPGQQVSVLQTEVED